MDDSTLMGKSNLFAKMFIDIPEHRKNEFIEEILEVNIHREKILSVVLIIIDIIMLYTDIFSYNDLRVRAYSLSSFLYTHIALLILPSIYLIVLHIIKIYKIKNCVNFKRALHIFLSSSILILCSFLSLNALLSKGQVFSFTIAIFCIASMGLFTVNERFIIYLSSYVFFIAGIFVVRNGVYELFWNVFFITLLIAVAIIASSINFSAYVNNLKNKKIILEKGIELDAMYKRIEEALKNRTEELTEANELLIDEIRAKHDMEIQYIKTMYLCEEKERELRESVEYEKLRTAFFANISHELRTPLTVISSAEQMLELLLKDNKIQCGKNEISQYMKIIKQNCNRLIRLIANLIDITKIDAGYFQVNLKNYDIVKVVEDITLSVAKFIECKNLNLIFDTEAEEKIIACDPDKIERIILNLLSNAVKFTPEGGDIYVNIYEREDKVIISVKDTGIGIPADKQSSIFDRFVQVDRTTSRISEGSGIGLSLVKSLVEMHGGRISLVSECGKGSEFIIELLDRTELSEAAMDKCSEIKGSDNIERVNVEFSDIYF